MNTPPALPELEVRPWKRLPPQYDHLDLVATTIDSHGRMIVLLVPSEYGFGAAMQDRTSAVRRPYDATAVIVDDQGHHEVELKDLDDRWPMIDTYGEALIIADSRCSLPARPKNAQPREDPWVDEADLGLVPNLTIFDGNGAPTTAFNVGDAIECLQTDARGGIWVGYFDEAAAWTPAPARVRHRPHFQNKRTMISAPGLIRWSVNGLTEWSAHDDPFRLSWMDCYALNVGADQVWACPYTDFPLVTIDDQGISTINRNPVRGASGFAVAGDDVLFVGPYGDKDLGLVSFVRCRRVDGVVTILEQSVLTLPDGSRPARLRRAVGRGHRLWVQVEDDRAWHLAEA